MSRSHLASRCCTAVDDQQFHADMAAMYAQQRQPRPSDIDVQAWKNRHLISAKLSAPLYADLMAFCRQRNFSINTGIKAILSSYFGKPNE